MKRLSPLCRVFPLFAGLLLTCAVGCGASAYRASDGAEFAVDNEKQIDDADVALAFAARPQMPDTTRIAYYAFDEEHDAEIEAMLHAVSGATSVYRIPRLLVTGQHHFDEPNHYGPPQDVGIKKLRLLAARAHADVLVVFDHGWRGGGVNGWVALNVLLLPALVTPWLSSETESYAQAYVIDVRNGYLYGEVSTEAKGGDGAVTIYGEKADDVAKKQWPELLAGIKKKLDTTVITNREASRDDAAKASAAAPPQPVSPPSGEAAARGE